MDRNRDVFLCYFSYGTIMENIGKISNHFSEYDRQFMEALEISAGDDIGNNFRHDVDF